MNGVRRLFAAAKPSSPSGSDLSPISPSQSNRPVVSFSASADANLKPEPESTLPAGIQLQANIPVLVTRPENQPATGSVNGVADSRLMLRGNPTSEDFPGEQGSDLRSSHLMRNSSAQPPSSNLPQQRHSRMATRDDLLLSLQTSEAIVDSREYETLTTEEVEALKEEQRYLASRTDAAKKKLNLELKLRDVSHNLQKLNASGVKTETVDKRDSVNKKLDVINAELIRSLEQLLGVDRRLLQHQSAVLSQSVRSLERQLNPESSDHINGFNDLPLSPKSTARSSYSSISTPSRAKFEGAHLFAGHAQSSLPTSPRYNQHTHRIQGIEETLKTTDEAKKLVETKLAALEEECQQLRQKNITLEKSYELRLSQAQNMIHDLEEKINKTLDAMQVQEQWERDKREWDDERKQLESQLAQRDLEREIWEENERNWRIDCQSLEDSVKDQRATISALEKNVNDLSMIRMEKEELDQLVLKKEDELRRLTEIMERNEASWQAEKARLEDEIKQARSAMGESHINGEVANGTLAELREILEELVDLHEIPHDSQDNAVRDLLSSIGNHLTSLSVNIKDLLEEKAVLEDQIRSYEKDLRRGAEYQERLRRELEEFQLLQREATTAIRELKEPTQTKELPGDSPSPDSLSAEYTRIIEQLKGLWAILPSVEARAPRIPKGGPISPQPSTMTFSLSDLDVRTLKTLYDPKQGFISPCVDGQFNLEEFVRMVHALVNDDRALIERLLRFAQSHDLLRNNAERAQKLAQESSKGLEMYQTQVRSLEERNMMLSRKQLTMMDEISSLQQSLETLTNEKDDLSVQTREQALVLQRLSSVLSERDRARVEESPMATKASLLVKYFTEMQTKLQETEDEVKQLRSVETSQRVALLDELNSLQQENNQLRGQLRNQR